MAALDRFMTTLVGTEWRAVSERNLPGSVETMERDAPSFFGSDIPALLSWCFDASEAARIQCPVLYVRRRQSEWLLVHRHAREGVASTPAC